MDVKKAPVLHDDKTWSIRITRCKWRPKTLKSVPDKQEKKTYVSMVWLSELQVCSCKDSSPQSCLTTMKEKHWAGEKEIRLWLLKKITVLNEGTAAPMLEPPAAFDVRRLQMCLWLYLSRTVLSNQLTHHQSWVLTTALTTAGIKPQTLYSRSGTWTVGGYI